uniref:SAM_MT_RSMB_NOP domain-containing protein n=1 Tax=Rhabditophanes sp. KR3021 TaxID=114890 RepID=A0AC35TZ71_9BILA
MDDWNDKALIKSLETNFGHIFLDLLMATLIYIKLFKLLHNNLVGKPTQLVYNNIRPRLNLITATNVLKISKRTSSSKIRLSEHIKEVKSELDKNSDALSLDIMKLKTMSSCFSVLLIFAAYSNFSRKYILIYLHESISLEHIKLNLTWRIKMMFVLSWVFLVIFYAFKKIFLVPPYEPAHVMAKFNKISKAINGMISMLIPNLKWLLSIVTCTRVLGDENNGSIKQIVPEGMNIPKKIEINKIQSKEENLLLTTLSKQNCLFHLTGDPTSHITLAKITALTDKRQQGTRTRKLTLQSNYIRIHIQQNTENIILVQVNSKKSFNLKELEENLNSIQTNLFYGQTTLHIQVWLHKQVSPSVILRQIGPLLEMFLNKFVNLNSIYFEDEGGPYRVSENSVTNYDESSYSNETITFINELNLVNIKSWENIKWDGLVSLITDTEFSINVENFKKLEKIEVEIYEKRQITSLEPRIGNKLSNAFKNGKISLLVFSCCRLFEEFETEQPPCNQISNKVFYKTLKQLNMPIHVKFEKFPYDQDLLDEIPSLLVHGLTFKLKHRGDIDQLLNNWNFKNLKFIEINRKKAHSDIKNYDYYNFIATSLANHKLEKFCLINKYNSFVNHDLLLHLPKTLKILSLRNVGTIRTEVCHQLARNLPNLLALSIDGEESKETNKYTNFTKLKFLAHSCPNQVSFVYPLALQVLIIDCRNHDLCKCLKIKKFTNSIELKEPDNNYFMFYNNIEDLKYYELAYKYDSMFDFKFD